MIKIGKKNVILLSIILISLGILFLAPLEYVDANGIIILGFLSRMFTG